MMCTCNVKPAARTEGGLLPGALERHYGQALAAAQAGDHDTAAAHVAVVTAALGAFTCTFCTAVLATPTLHVDIVS
jgi:hypothetical protein